MIFQKLALVWLLVLTGVNAITITQNTVVSGSTFYGASSVSAGVYFLLDSGLLHTFTSDLTNNGLLYVGDKTLLPGITVQLSGFSGNVLNTGNLVLNDLTGTLGPTYIWNGNLFTNNGNVWFAGIGSLGGSTFNIAPLNTLMNTGTITYYQSISNTGSSAYIGSSGSTFTNAGTVCLFQTGATQSATVNGNGCWDVQTQSNLWIRGASVNVMTTQTILLSTSTSSLRIDIMPPAYTFTVAGWVVET